MVRALLLALIVALLAPEAVLASPRWPTKTVRVYDHSDAEWRPLVEETVADFNAILPSRGLKLIYVAMPEESCPTRTRRTRQGAITVCVRPSPTAVGRGAARATEGAIAWARVELAPSATIPAWDRERLVCHEFAHVVLWVRDNNQYDPMTGLTTWPLPEESCVWGALPDPGSWDIAHAQAIYDRDVKREGKKRRHHSRPRNR